jgi:glutathionylspermidine synthase
VERELIPQRPDVAKKLESVGLSFHSWDDYWKEDACYRFSAREVAELESATQALHGMCLNAMRKVCTEGRLGEIGVPKGFHDAVERSFWKDDFSIYGRFDLAYDGKSPPKMLEYNADTPTSLLESAVAQWYWMEDCFPQHDQFNSLHERLVERWRSLPGDGQVHVASLAENEEDWVCSTYMQDCIVQSGREAKHIYIEDVGWDARRNCFVDLDNRPITHLFKLYPWEWIMKESFGQYVASCATRFVEPLWKSALSSKALLPILWELYPDHPNLLPAYFEPSHLESYAKKPIFSREGANIELHQNGTLIASDSGPYGAEGYIYQGLCKLPQFDDRYPVIGSWVVDGQPAGICVREDTLPITTNLSNFVPHYFTE